MSVDTLKRSTVVKIIEKYSYNEVFVLFPNGVPLISFEGNSYAAFMTVNKKKEVFFKVLDYGNDYEIAHTFRIESLESILLVKNRNVFLLNIDNIVYFGKSFDVNEYYKSILSILKKVLKQKNPFKKRKRMNVTQLADGEKYGKGNVGEVAQFELRFELNDEIVLLRKYENFGFGLVVKNFDKMDYECGVFPLSICEKRKKSKFLPKFLPSIKFSRKKEKEISQKRKNVEIHDHDAEEFTKKSTFKEDQTEGGQEVFYKMRACYDYTAKRDDELSFKKGDIIHVTGKKEQKWWLGRKTDGVEGLFPTNYCDFVQSEENDVQKTDMMERDVEDGSPLEEKEEEGKETERIDENKIEESTSFLDELKNKVKKRSEIVPSTFIYGDSEDKEGERGDDFSENQQLTREDTHSSGGGRKNFLSELKNKMKERSERSKETVPGSENLVGGYQQLLNESSGNGKMVALFEYKAQRDDEMDINVNDEIVVLEKTEELWWMGKNSNTLRSGLFPANYCREIETGGMNSIPPGIKKILESYETILKEEKVEIVNKKAFVDEMKYNLNVLKQMKDALEKRSLILRKNCNVDDVKEEGGDGKTKIIKNSSKLYSIVERYERIIREKKMEAQVFQEFEEKKRMKEITDIEEEIRFIEQIMNTFEKKLEEM